MAVSALLLPRHDTKGNKLLRYSVSSRLKVVKSTVRTRTSGRLGLPFQRHNGRQADGAPHHGVFGVNAIYGSHDKRTRLVAPTMTVGPDLQQASMAARMAMRRVADPAMLHEAT